MNSALVIPKKWLNPSYPIKILYDDTDYSIIWGMYEGTKSMGTRWNGAGSDRGYPGQGGSPLWHLVPDFVALGIIRELINKAISKDPSCNVDNIKFAQVELRDKLI